MRVLTLGLVATLVLGPTACISPSDPWGHADALKLAQKRYTEAIRWGKFEKAASYVTPELRDAFLALGDAFETVRITDVEIGEFDVDEEDFLEAEIDVTYHGYTLPHYVEMRVSARQVWVREDGVANDWRVQPDLASVLDGLGVEHP